MSSERKQAKRERILDAAITEFARRGYFDTNVSSIARRAGVADGTIYLYFKSKEELLVSIFERAMQRFIVEGEAAISDRVGAAEQLRTLIAFHLSVVGRDRDLALIFQVELRHSLHFLELFSRSRIRDYLTVISDVIQRGQKEGSFRDGIDPLLAAKALFGLLDEMATDWVLSARNTRLESRAGAVADLFMNGIRCAPS